MAKADQNESKSVDPHITDVSHKVKTLLVRANRHDVLARYEVSVLLRNVMADAKYADNAITQMQSEVGLSKQSLYRIARVAQAWPESEFGELVKRPNSKGWPLTWSHFELLAMTDLARRTDLFELALAESLTVAELVVAVKAKNPSQSSVSLDTATDAHGQTFAADLNRWVLEIEEEMGIWNDRFRVDVESTVKSLDDAGRENLRATAGRLKGAALFVLVIAERLENALPKASQSSAQVHQFPPAPQADAAAG